MWALANLHKLCLEVKASPTNGYLLALIYITYLFSEELIKQHNITKIKDLVYNQQQFLKKAKDVYLQQASFLHQL